MFPIVEFCVSNLAQGSQEAKEILEKDPNLDVVEYGTPELLRTMHADDVCSCKRRNGDSE